ncbi:MAG: DEAD/DEAH box helicase [Betaproteobacteria bacterium]|nr:DEAD/DEAH box helicase [Betaproteobacteria bacterium]NBP44048.1 DEAD/DEAH box helicase [Betaproteobacteria bacterium]
MVDAFQPSWIPREMNSTHTEQTAVAPAFCPFDLAPFLKDAVASLGFESPTSVQSTVWDHWVKAADQAPNLLVSSQTGSGKTLAFLLPVLQSIELQRTGQMAQKSPNAEAPADAFGKRKAATKRRNPYNPRHFVTPKPSALILCPTRELAQQVANDAINLVRAGKGPRVACLVGGMPYAVQMSRLQNVDMVIATPGRLLDLADSGSLDLSAVQWLVLDEADRMLDLGFAPDLARVDEMTAQRACTMMFSATFDPPIERLAKALAPGATRLQLHDNRKAHESIEQRLYWADDEAHRSRLLEHWLRDVNIEQAIIFTSTQVGCEALAQYLQDEGFSAMALHGALSQAVRNRRLTQLRSGRLKFLVATDVAARGIDVPGISHVFNHGLPMKEEDHVHRIGRTGRAGRKGLAVTFALMRESRKVNAIEQYLGRPMAVHVVEGLEPRQRLSKPKHAATKPGSGHRGQRSRNGGTSTAKPRSGDRFARADGAPKSTSHASPGSRTGRDEAHHAHAGHRTHKSRPATGQGKSGAGRPPI